MRLLFSCPFLDKRKESAYAKEKNAAIEPQVTDTEKNPVITSKKNGTTFTIVLKSSENAMQGFEDLMKEMIGKEAFLLDLCGFEGN